MDDVDISSQQDGFALKYNASTGKYDFGEVASDLTSVSQNIVPDGDGTRDIGSASKAFNNGYFKNVFVSGSTLEAGANGVRVKEDSPWFNLCADIYLESIPICKLRSHLQRL